MDILNYRLDNCASGSGLEGNFSRSVHPNRFLESGRPVYKPTSRIASVWSISNGLKQFVPGSFIFHNQLRCTGVRTVVEFSTFRLEKVSKAAYC
jgi:hypothetical protein